MKQWTQLGKFLAGHMQIIVPLCAALGILFPQQIGVMKPAVTALFAFMTFQGALSNTFKQVADVIRKPRLLIIVLALSAVAIPVVAYLLGSLLFGSNPNIVCGIVIEYSVPVAVSAFMWITMFNGNGALALTIIFISSVISPLTIPLTLKLLLGASVSVDALSMVRSMTIMVALPALLGIIVNQTTHGWGAEKLSPALSPACKFAMMVIIMANSTSMSPYVLNMNLQRVGVFFFILAFALGGFVLGIIVARLLHLPHGDMATVCFSCGMRNISSGAVIASQYFPGEVVFPVMCGTVFQQLIASFVGRFLQRLDSSNGEERTQAKNADAK